MHGLINRSIQCFLRDTYGPDVWGQIALDARIGHENFEAMLIYEDRQSVAVLVAASNTLGRPAASILEDIGTYLVSGGTYLGLRRLLRFGGETFQEFLHSLEDLRDRVRLAVPDLVLPAIELADLGGGAYRVQVAAGLPGYGQALVGILRAMADDYGALVMLELEGGAQGGEVIAVSLLETEFAAGRSFELAGEVS